MNNRLDAFVTWMQMHVNCIRLESNIIEDYRNVNAICSRINPLYTDLFSIRNLDDIERAIKLLRTTSIKHRFSVFSLVRITELLSWYAYYLQSTSKVLITDNTCIIDFNQMTFYKRIVRSELHNPINEIHTVETRENLIDHNSPSLQKTNESEFRQEFISWMIKRQFTEAERNDHLNTLDSIQEYAQKKNYASKNVYSTNPLENKDTIISVYNTTDFKNGYKNINKLKHIINNYFVFLSLKSANKGIWNIDKYEHQTSEPHIQTNSIDQHIIESQQQTDKIAIISDSQVQPKAKNSTNILVTKTGYNTWMKQHAYKDSKRIRFLNELEMIVKFSKINNLPLNSLFDVSPEEGRDCLYSVFTDKRFVRSYRSSIVSAVDAATDYLLYISEKQSMKEPWSIDAVIDKQHLYTNTTQQRAMKALTQNALPNTKEEISKARVAFITWLKENDYADATAITMLSSIAKVGELAQEKHIIDRSLFLFQDKKTVDKIWEKMIHQESFIQFNKQQHFRFTSAMNKYLLFLSSLDKSKDEQSEGHSHTDVILNKQQFLEDGHNKITTRDQNTEVAGCVKSANDSSEKDLLINLLEIKGLTYIDKRKKGGALWVVGSYQLSYFMRRLKEYGINFHLKLGGGNLTGGKDAWWTTDSKYKQSLAAEIDKEKPQDASDLTNSEIQELLNDEIYSPLRKALVQHGIKTIEDLRKVKLWAFMNRYDLYSIGQRQAILTKVNNLLNPVKNLSAGETCVLQVGNETFVGPTASHAFMQFCNYIFSKYPLRFKLLIGMKAKDMSEAPIQRVQTSADYLEMPMLHAYINSKMSSEEVVRFSAWICDKCGEDSRDIAISEPIRRIDLTPPASEVKDNRIYAKEREKKKDADEGKNREQRDKEIISRIEQYVLKADLDGVSYDDVKNAMHISMVSTKQYILEASNIVSIKGKLIHKEAFIDWEEGANQIEDILEKLMIKNNGYVSASQLYEYAKIDMNMFLNDNDINDEQSVFDIAKHLFEMNGYHDKHYVFSGNSHISRKENAVTSNLQLIKKYAEDKGGVFAFNSLVEYLENVGIHTGNLRAQMKIPNEPIFFYCAEGLILYAGSMNINKDWLAVVSRALRDLFADAGDHIILRDIPDIWFERLPELPKRLPWTPLLLQSILRCYSQDLGALTIPAMAGQSIDTLHTMLVSQDCPIRDFGDVIIAYLIDTNNKQRDFEAEELRKLLVNAGIIQGNELLWNMPKALQNDGRFAWNISGDHVVIEV